MELSKPGPVVPTSYPRVIFRINGEKVVRVFDPRKLVVHPTHKDYLEAIAKGEIGTLVSWCNDFINLRCRPLMISPDCGQTWNHLYNEVDFFYSDHPLITKE